MATGSVPLVLVAENGGELSGLLVLARDEANGAIAAVGAHQSEYQAWLCRPGDSEEFLASSVDELRTRFPGGKLRLLYFPDSSEAAKVFDGERLAGNVVSREHRRPLLEIGDGDAIAASLKKKSNKSKINRLKRHGELALREFSSRAELEGVIDEIAALYDVRQSAANRSAPFFEDPHKREFHLRLMERGLLHAATLSVGDEIVAALLSVPDRGALAVGVFAISARLASESPGKILLLLLGRDLVAAGVQRIDLTPGGAWKDRFANHFDTVQELSVYFDRGDAEAARRKERMTDLAKAGLGRLGVTPDRARSWVAAVTPSAMRSWPGRVWTTEVQAVYELELAPKADAGPAEPACGVRAVAYPATESEQELHDFLGVCFERFETGWQCHAVRRDGHLEKLFWLIDVSGRDVVALGDVQVPVDEASWLLDVSMHRRFPPLAAPAPEDLAACLRRMGQSAAPRKVVAVLEVSDDAMERVARSVGFRPKSRITVRCRFGEEQQLIAEAAGES